MVEMDWNVVDDSVTVGDPEDGVSIVELNGIVVDDSITLGTPEDNRSTVTLVGIVRNDSVIADETVLVEVSTLIEDSVVGVNVSIDDEVIVRASITSNELLIEGSVVGGDMDDKGVKDDSVITEMSMLVEGSILVEGSMLVETSAVVDTSRIADVVVKKDKLLVAGIGGRQCPAPSGTSLMHLQATEHSLPSSPFSAPLSHSSPMLACQIPSPQPAGVAPRAKM